MYYNTTNETGETLMEYAMKAKRQRDIVLEILRRTGEEMTSSQILPIYINATKMSYTPITSMRRCVTELHDDGKIQRTGKTSKHNPFNRPEFIYKALTK